MMIRDRYPNWWREAKRHREDVRQARIRELCAMRGCLIALVTIIIIGLASGAITVSMW